MVEVIASERRPVGPWPDDSTGWSVPATGEEWVLMYRQGLSKRQIAEVCSASLRLVSRRINAVCKSDPSLDQDHVGHSAKLDPDTMRANAELARWEDAFGQFHHFVSVHGRIPWMGGHELKEHLLAKWLTAQRRRYMTGDLGTSQEQQLNAVAEWKIPRREQLARQQWHARFDQLVAFIGSEQTWPVWRNPHSDDERQIGMWLHAQRQRFRRSLLGQDLVNLLDERLPGWYDPARRNRNADFA